MGVTKVYIESFRDGYQAEESTLKAARDFFRQAGPGGFRLRHHHRDWQALDRLEGRRLLYASPESGAAGVHLSLHRRPL